MTALDSLRLALAIEHQRRRIRRLDIFGQAYGWPDDSAVAVVDQVRVLVELQEMAEDPAGGGPVEARR